MIGQPKDLWHLLDSALVMPKGIARKIPMHDLTSRPRMMDWQKKERAAMSVFSPAGKAPRTIINWHAENFTEERVYG